MPDLNEFLNKKSEEKPYELEYLNGVRACSKCDEDVSGAYWDPVDLVMSWRCSKSHEYIFLLSKSPKYYFDNKSIKVPMSANSTPSKSVRGKNPSSNAPIGQPNQLGSGSRGCDDGLVNKRSVWTVNTKPYKEAHFAVFPTDLIEPCIKAGSPRDGHVLDPSPAAVGFRPRLPPGPEPGHEASDELPVVGVAGVEPVADAPAG